MNAWDASVQCKLVSAIAHDLARRLFDLTVAGLATIVFAPLMTLIALVLLVESGPPVLFVQTRLGQHGRPFRMYKFRKFGPHCASGLPLTLVGDRRMTTVGRVLAYTKLDELPQLLNVLKGEMAIVGPRPESPVFAECFRGRYEKIQGYKPGLIGPSQIIFRHESCLYPKYVDPITFYKDVLFPAKASIDVSYYSHRTIISDIFLIMRAAGALFRAAPLRIDD